MHESMHPPSQKWEPIDLGEGDNSEEEVVPRSDKMIAMMNIGEKVAGKRRINMIKGERHPQKLFDIFLIKEEDLVVKQSIFQIILLTPGTLIQ
jgi:hypothetical protein